jgi:hypothetical protein
MGTAADQGGDDRRQNLIIHGLISPGLSSRRAETLQVRSNSPVMGKQIARMPVDREGLAHARYDSKFPLQVTSTSSDEMHHDLIGSEPPAIRDFSQVILIKR